MTKVVARSLSEAAGNRLEVEVVAVEFRLGVLRIEMSELGGDRSVEVSFAQVEAFRVMDERDLGEYWPVCSSSNGRIFEVTSGGWLSQERERPYSLVAKIHGELQEYLVS